MLLLCMPFSFKIYIYISVYFDFKLFLFNFLSKLRCNVTVNKQQHSKVRWCLNLKTLTSLTMNSLVSDLLCFQNKLYTTITTLGLSTKVLMRNKTICNYMYVTTRQHKSCRRLSYMLKLLRRLLTDWRVDRECPYKAERSVSFCWGQTFVNIHMGESSKTDSPDAMLQCLTVHRRVATLSILSKT